MRSVELDGGQLFRQRPLDVFGDRSEHGDGILALLEAYDLEIAGGELDGVVSVDEVDDRAGDRDVRLLDELRRRRRGAPRRREEVVQVVHVDGGVER